MSFNQPIKAAKDINGVRRSAFWHLGRRDHSEKELREKISRKTDNQQWIETVIDECLQNNYLNDGRFTDNFIRSAQNKGYGLNRIKNDLQRKGIANHYLTQRLETDSYNYIDAAVVLLSRKYPQRIGNQHLKQKAMHFLQSKGHCFDDIFNAIEQHNKAFAEDDQNDLNDAVMLLSAKFKVVINERKQHDKALRFLVSRGFQFSEAADAIKAHNMRLDSDNN